MISLLTLYCEYKEIGSNFGKTIYLYILINIIYNISQIKNKFSYEICNVLENI